MSNLNLPMLKFSSSMPWRLLLLGAALGERFGGERSRVGDRIGARLIRDERQTAGAEFWAATPVSTAARDEFAIVSASLWLGGGWGQTESAIAAQILARECASGAGVMVDVGAHVGCCSLFAPLSRPRSLGRMRPEASPFSPLTDTSRCSRARTGAARAASS